LAHPPDAIGPKLCHELGVMTILQAVLAVYASVLEIPGVDPDADVYDLGGDSVQAVQIALELEVELGVAIPLEAFEDSSSPRAIARWIEAELDARARPAASG
jgi:acyl carrier protein